MTNEHLTSGALLRPDAIEAPRCVQKARYEVWRVTLLILLTVCRSSRVTMMGTGWRRGVAVERRTRDREVVGSSLSRALRRKNSGQVSHTYG